MTRIKNAGAIFIGAYSCEPLGDYFAGPNHVLPTNGTAKFFSPLSVDDFIKKSSVIYYSREALEPSTIPTSSIVWWQSTYRSPSTSTSRSKNPWRANAFNIWSKKPIPVWMFPFPFPSRSMESLIFVSLVFLSIDALLLISLSFLVIFKSYYSREALEPVHKDIEFFANQEQLTAHANSMKVRFEDNQEEFFYHLCVKFANTVNGKVTIHHKIWSSR